MNNLLRYFDLNERVYHSIVDTQGVSILVTRTRSRSGKKNTQVSITKDTEEKESLERVTNRVRRMPFWEQLTLYLGTVIGVAFSSAVTEFQNGKATNSTISILTIVSSAIIALVIIPIIFEKLHVDPDAPFLVRFGLFVQQGVFWQVLFGSIGKALAL